MITLSPSLLRVALLSLATFNIATGRTLTVAGIGSKPFLDIRCLKNGLPSGIEMDVLSIIAKKWNFSLTFQRTNTWATMLNGSWAGTIGKVLGGKADIGVQIAMTSSRSKVVQFSHFIAPHHAVLHSLKPQPLPPYFNLIKPFSHEVWASVIMCPIIVALATASLIERKKGRFLNKALNMEFDLLASMVCQSRPFCFLSNPPFIPILISWLAFSTIMYMAFNCKLRAYLISVDYEDEINSIEDVNRLGKKLYSVRSELNDALAHSPNSAHRKAYKDMVKNNRFINWEHGIPLSFDNKMLHNDAVGLLPSMIHLSRLDEIQNRFGLIPFRQGSQSIIFFYSALVFPKGSEIFPLFDISLQYLHDTGLMAKLTRDNVQVDKYGQNLKSDADVALGMGHISVPLITYSILIVISTVILLCEKVNLSST